MTEREKHFLVKSGGFAAETFAEEERRAEKGSLEIMMATTFLDALTATLTLTEAAAYLGWSEPDVRTGFTDGNLYGVEISGQLRFPSWQFDVGSPQKLLPSLPAVITALAEENWISAAGYMSTPQSSLVAEGQQTPIEWLRRGGDVAAVEAIIEGDSYW